VAVLLFAIWTTTFALVLLLAHLMDQYCFACLCLSSVVVVCNAAGRVGDQPPAGRPRERSGG